MVQNDTLKNGREKFTTRPKNEFEPNFFLTKDPIYVSGISEFTKEELSAVLSSSSF